MELQKTRTIRAQDLHFFAIKMLQASPGNHTQMPIYFRFYANQSDKPAK